MNKLNTRLKDIKPKDLLFVILYGVVLSVLLGIVLGFVDYYIRQYITFSFALLMFFICSQYIGGMVRRQYEFPHIVYTVLTGVFLVFQAVIIYSLPLIYEAAIGLGDISLVFNFGLYFEFFIYLIKGLFTNFSFDYLIMVLFIVVGTYVGVKRTY